MLQAYLQTSNFILWLQRILSRYYWPKINRLGIIYNNSQTYNFIHAFWKSIRVSFQNSFIGRIQPEKLNIEYQNYR